MLDFGDEVKPIMQDPWAGTGVMQRLGGPIEVAPVTPDPAPAAMQRVLAEAGSCRRCASGTRGPQSNPTNH
ncbi:MAG: hypothetical protein H7232_12210 [Aeromicrobium sp.]|nr:hypothetical protein [Burkholderiales bacterium]